MARVAIIGSCVTRDIWPAFGNPGEELFFVARTGFISLMSPALSENGAAFLSEPSSAFERRCLEADIGKKTMQELEAFRPDFLILDFIDERFDILQIGSSFVTFSAEFQMAGGFALPWARLGTFRDRLSPHTFWLWIQSAKHFAFKIRHTLNSHQTHVILHRAPWAVQRVQPRTLTKPTYVAPELAIIAPGKRVNIVDYGFLMRCYYDIFQSLLPQVDSIEAPLALQVGSDSHPWGASPFHYVDEYYQFVGAELRRLGVPL